MSDHSGCVRVTAATRTVTMRLLTLLAGIIWLSSTHAKSEPKGVYFSQGIDLTVNAKFSKGGSLDVQILLPVDGQMDTSKTTILTCIVRGLRTKVKDITWKINNTRVTRSHTNCEVFREADGTFTAVAFYFAPVPERKSIGNVFRCEVQEDGITHYEEVSPSDCGHTGTL